ncbi:hypothetical protein M2227_003438 [Bradyrhizobium elkanii]|uniref:hypothetical protein n=1 Tax=Bradyrhizobium elkanii TaxID=29448 RepID=UPI00222717E3|nr:hypothetical protein [Bradyrhizobium elkanii]MCW2110278.1 hypothetical protein [Bradyrhizobium elkanii]MCW2201348.1 hypothetical protein [Bradyrhizobium elkanii]WLB76445.1 hypothetical protein QIH89_22145 [Bradyrhizobium elkanii]
MTVIGLEELAEMAVQLESAARKLPPSQERDALLQDVARFRVQLTAILLERKAKGK